MKGVHWLLIVAVAWWLRQGGAPPVPGMCEHRCGDVNVPFPFGLDPNCVRSPDFLLNCTNIEGSGTQLQWGNLTIHKISVGDSTMIASLPEAYECYHQNGTLANKSNPRAIDLSPNPRYRFSETQNKLVVVGCNAFASVADGEGTDRSACVSYCSGNDDFANETTCSGQGCCQAYIPKGLTTLNINISSYGQNVPKSQHGRCARAFVVDNRPFNISNLTLQTFQDVGNNSGLVVDWMVKSDVKCVMAERNKSSYACHNNTDCRNFGNGPDYRCVCKRGYHGNPYSPFGGCKAICPVGKKHRKKNNNDSCEIPPGVIAGAAIAVSVFGVTVTGSVSVTMRLRLRKINFRRNGGELLQQRKVQIFTEEELAKATNNYSDNNKLNNDHSSSVYGGTIAGDTVVVVKKPQDEHKSIIRQDFQDELEFLMKKSHKNMVKLKGICLETEIPLLVYEYIPNGTLFKLIQQNELTWEQRFKIAAEAALALNHMHSSTQPPIFHGNIKLANILMGRNNSVKISDFGTSVLISPEHRHIVAIQKKDSLHYIDPEYLVTSMLTIQSDVYSFGVVLMELLMGKKLHVTKSEKSINTIHHFISSVKGDTLSDVISFESASQDEMKKIRTVAEIAVRCLDQSGANRPAMSVVAEQLANVYPISTDKEEDEEKEEDKETKREVDANDLSSCLSCLGMDSCI
ncbi:hypothetical protein ACJRO7_023771 [Eucalyptus globulus]|uniref:Protein kinase domain-containing protein n=1 Tax=Eucalyptus globulus TaxID=34317 RepID=A0ABD3KC51_EUCGL